MIVLIDAGNTNLKLACLTPSGAINRITSRQFYELIDEVKQVVYAVVAGSQGLDNIISSCHDNEIPTKKVSVTNSFNNIECAYDKVDNLGVDRWLAILGARQYYEDNKLIIVDSGTAITVDVCIKNQHLGGWIAPGLSLMQKSIVDKAPGVFSSTEIKDELFGTNTPSALFHGCIYALTGMIGNAQQLLLKFDNVENKPPKIILTGGDASLISEYLNLPCVVNNELVFIGLKQFVNN